MIYPGEGKKGQPKAGDYVLAAEQTRAEAAASPHRSTAVDLARARAELFRYIPLYDVRDFSRLCFSKGAA
jgi:hypothetical protein